MKARILYPVPTRAQEARARQSAININALPADLFSDYDPAVIEITINAKFAWYLAENNIRMNIHRVWAHARPFRGERPSEHEDDAFVPISDIDIGGEG